MANVAFLHPAQAAAVAPLHPAAMRERAPRHAAGGAFWSHGVCMGISVILATMGEVDTLSRRMGQLPTRTDPTRPMVGQYLFMVKTLAAAWEQHSRPVLLAACAALRHYGAGFTEGDSAHLAAALQRAAGGEADAFAVAARLIDGLHRRIAAPVAGFAALHEDFGSYLGQMAGASADLESDTVLVTQRLQSDHVHAFVLAQHVNALQEKLGEARARGKGCAPPGAQAGGACRDSVAHSAALDDARRRLDRLREGQAGAAAEAAWLQQLLPGVSAYLGSIDRMGVGIHAALSGARALQESLVRLQRDVAGGAPGCGAARDELLAALPGWRELTARLAQLPGDPGA